MRVASEVKRFEETAVQLRLCWVPYSENVAAADNVTQCVGGRGTRHDHDEQQQRHSDHCREGAVSGLHGHRIFTLNLSVPTRIDWSHGAQECALESCCAIRLRCDLDS
jgi:hypothetical protein